MRFKQVKELLVAIGDARLAIAKLYARLAGEVDSMRTRMVLEYLAAKEKEQSEEMARYLQQAPTAVVNTWFQNVYEGDFLQRVNRTRFDAGASPQDVLALALALDNELIELLAQRAAEAPTPESRDVLLAVMAEEQLHQRKMVLNIARFEDV